VITSESVGSNPVTHPNGYDVSISTSAAFSGAVEVTCTHNKGSTATHTIAIIITELPAITSITSVESSYEVGSGT
jgi:hypothetical protein